jgi:tetratricopeptide (TPR) repeat protein
MRLPSVFFLFLLPMHVLAAADLLSALALDLPGVTADIQQVHYRITEQRKAGDLDAALATGRQIVELVKRNAAEDDSILLARPYSNLATLQLLRSDLETATINFNLSIGILEKHQGDYSPDLVLPLQGLGMTFTKARDYEQATAALRRAQHITHRTFGVYSLEQISLVDQLSHINAAKGNLVSANRQKRFTLKIAEVEYGSDDPRLVPTIERLADYFVTVGNNPEAVALYRRAVDIIEENYDENDLRLSDPLLNLGKIGMQRSEYRTRGEHALERRRAIISESPETDVRDRVRAVVDLADAYTISNNRKAADTYRYAWELIKEKPDFADLREDIFGTPLRLYPKPRIYPVDRFPSATSEELFADVEFTVRDDGRVSDIEIVAANVPNESRRWLRTSMYNYRYRPRMIDGEPVATEKLTLHQPFALIERPVPTTLIRVQQGP